jgi:hypothetical protein
MLSLLQLVLPSENPLVNSCVHRTAQPLVQHELRLHQLDLFRYRAFCHHPLPSAETHTSNAGLAPLLQQDAHAYHGSAHPGTMEVQRPVCMHVIHPTLQSAFECYPLAD